MKGIILAGGRGTRLSPITKGVSKQLLPVYDKPLIYYPLSILLIAGIKEVLIISTPEDIQSYQRLFEDGSQLGIQMDYAIQDEPKGLAEAFIIGETFIKRGGKDEGVCLILGDNIFYGQHFSVALKRAKDHIQKKGGAYIFGYPVNNPSDFGVVAFDEERRVVGIEEKPKKPKSNYAVPGLYFYDSSVVEVAKGVLPSDRGEVEITAVNEYYLNRGELQVLLMGRGMAWLDTGSPDRLFKASAFVNSIQEMQGNYVACVEEIVWRSGYITTEQLLNLGMAMKNTEYGQYIIKLAKES